MDQQLKQRLVGAIVLVSLGVIFIPVILEGPRDEWAPREHNIPEPPALEYRAPAELPIPAPAQPAEQAGNPDDDGPVPEKQPSPAAPSVAPRVEKTVPAPPPAPTAAADTDSPALKDGWYVQVGSFSQADNAGRMRDRLQAEDVNAYLHTVESGKTTSYRVMVGPVKTRTQAENLQQQLAGRQQLKGLVIRIGDDAGG